MRNMSTMSRPEIFSTEFLECSFLWCGPSPVFCGFRYIVSYILIIQCFDMELGLKNDSKMLNNAHCALSSLIHSFRKVNVLKLASTFRSIKQGVTRSGQYHFLSSFSPLQSTTKIGLQFTTVKVALGNS